MEPRGLPLVIVPFAVSGVIHLVRPETFEPIIPRPLRRWSRELVLISGVAELACAAGLLHPRTRPAAGLVSAGLLTAVWPANVQMSVDLGRRAARRRDARSVTAFTASLLRLPLQVPLIRISWRLWTDSNTAPSDGAGRRQDGKGHDGDHDGDSALGALTKDDLEHLRSAQGGSGVRYELLDGSVIMTPSPGRWHQTAAFELACLLRDNKPDNLVRADGALRRRAGR